MKSKTVELKTSSAEKPKVKNSYDFLEYNKPFDFVGLYKTAAETSKILEKRKHDDSQKDEINNKGSKRDHINKKKNKHELDISQTNIDPSSLNSGGADNFQHNSLKVSSTSIGSASAKGKRVKSIMKNSSLTDQSVDSGRSNTSSAKSKKRNKSVSFMLDDNEEVVVKRTKSDDSIKTVKKVDTAKPNDKEKKKPFKKIKKDQQSEKENTATHVNKQNSKIDSGTLVPQDKKPTRIFRAKKFTEPTVTTVTDEQPQTQDKKKKFKKVKKVKAELNADTMDTGNNNHEVTSVIKTKKQKQKKQKVTSEKIDVKEGDEEPVSKSRKKESKQDIAEDLENLSIGDNAHTLSNLLDEMTVVDKEKKKLKSKNVKNKRPKGPSKEESENPEEGKEKVKWKKRKWNKDKKGDLDEERLSCTVVVENLPLHIMLNYKKLLADHFVSCGLIKKIGVAEVYPSEESKPVFTTTINFYSDGAAEQALEKNQSDFEGSRIRVKRALPATATTVVVRSYAELSDQNLSTTFHSLGKIRSIRHLVKGKKATSTAFVEFHGPEAVEGALKLASEVKIGGKRMHVAKFEVRTKKKKEKKPKNEGDSAADADSEDSED